jgi:dipeptidyl aminopeptidase/acylaminoacyl peptidase
VFGLAVGSASSAGPEPCGDPSFVTIGGGQSAANNAKVTTTVFGNILTAQSSGTRIAVCAGTTVTTVSSDTTPGAANVTKVSPGVTDCGGADATCTIAALSSTQKFTVKSADGKDTDTLTFLPQ